MPAPALIALLLPLLLSSMQHRLPPRPHPTAAAWPVCRTLTSDKGDYEKFRFDYCRQSEVAPAAGGPVRFPQPAGSTPAASYWHVALSSRLRICRPRYGALTAGADPPSNHLLTARAWRPPGVTRWVTGTRNATTAGPCVALPYSDRGWGMPASSARTSVSRYRRWPPRVRMDVSLPALAHRVTVLGSTRNIVATSAGVSRGSASGVRADICTASPPGPVLRSCVVALSGSGWSLPWMSYMAY